MFILDTNVISELMRAQPAESVVRWANSMAVEEFATTAICLAEILYGLAIMPDGKRRKELEQGAKLFFEQKLAGRIYPFDSEAAAAYAQFRGRRSAMGWPMREPDAQIAAICAIHNAALITRDVSDFEHIGLQLINPWSE